MGGFGSTPRAPKAGKAIVAGGFADDNIRSMPSINDPVAAENARLRLLKLQSSSGRTSTDLSGTRPFVNTFLGGTK